MTAALVDQSFNNGRAPVNPVLDNTIPNNKRSQSLHPLFVVRRAENQCWDTFRFAEHISMQQAHGELLGFEQFRDDSLQIDYGAIEAYNTAMQSGDDFTGGQPPAGGQRFDVAKAIFNQVDANHDGAITRDEFRQWAQGKRQNVGGQTTSQSYGNSYEANTGNIGGQQQVFAGDSPDVANILQQSGLGQAFGNYR